MSKKIITSLIAIIILSSCYDETDGCLDSAATNFDFFADVTCEDCCSYPDLTIRFEPFWGDEFLDSDSTYFLEGDSIRFLDISFLAYDFSITNDPIDIEIEETFDVTSLAGVELSFKEDIAYVTNNQFNYTLGTIRESGTATALSFNIGLDPELDVITPDNFETGNPLFDNQDSLYCATTNNYTKVKLVLEHKTLDADTIVYNLKGNPLDIVEVPLDSTYAQGVDISIDIAIDFQLLLENVELVDTDQTILSTVILSQISKIFKEN